MPRTYFWREVDLDHLPPLFSKNPGLMWYDILVYWASITADHARSWQMPKLKIGTNTYGPPYKDLGLPTDEFCACGKRLWALTEHNVDWHVNGRQGGGGCAALEWRRWQEASAIESEVERWRTKARETAEGLMSQEIETATSQGAKARCRELEAQCEAKCKDIEAAVRGSLRDRSPKHRPNLAEFTQNFSQQMVSRSAITTPNLRVGKSSLR